MGVSLWPEYILDVVRYLPKNDRSRTAELRLTRDARNGQVMVMTRRTCDGVLTGC